MEANLQSVSPPPSTVVDRADELNRSNSDASSLTAENCKDILGGSDNVTPDDCTAWTDEKHSSYLSHLEVSFVKQLHQSMGLLAPCSEQNQRDKKVSMRRPINVHNASEQYGCWQKNNYERSKPLSRSQADSHNPLKSPWMYNVKRMRKHCPPPSSDMPEFLKLCNTENHGKAIISHGLETRPHKYSASKACLGDLDDLTREGTGQNFVDEDNQNKSNTEPRAKRWKTA